MLSSVCRNGYFRTVKHVQLFSLLVPLMLFLAACSGGGEPSAQRGEGFDTLRLVVEQTTHLSRLHTTELQIHKLVTHTDQSRLRGTILSVPIDIGLKPGERKVAIPIDVTVHASIDLTKFTKDNVVRQGDKYVITLPDPQIEVTAARIDHGGVRQYVDPLRSQFSDSELTALARQGEETLVRNLDKPAIVERARQDARLVLLPMLRRCGLGPADVSIAFRGDLRADSLRVVRMK